MVGGAGRSAVVDDLGDGLVLRQATAADADALAGFNADLHRFPDAPEPDAGMAIWTRELLSGAHPTVSASDFTVVEDTRTGALISTLCLISQTWSYGGIPFGVGRIELVGTHPDYRRRRLVRRQMEVIHARSAARGHLVQAITGIPNYYRRFGYEHALALGGGRRGYRSLIPDLPAGIDEPFLVRPLTEADLPLLETIDRRIRQRCLVACLRDEGLWRYELVGRPAGSIVRSLLRVIETPAGQSVGVLIHPDRLSESGLSVLIYELLPGVSWLNATPSVLRYLRATGESWADQSPADRFEEFRFSVGSDHPVYQAIADQLPGSREPYTWYLRVADLPGFLRHVAPVLEARLAESIAVGQTAELRLNFYETGLRLTLRDGRLAAVTPWPAAHHLDSAASFPGLTFLQLLFGHRSRVELEHGFADCRVRTQEARVLLDVLFPRRPSQVEPVS